MSYLGVADGDSLYRHCLFPQSFSGNKKPKFAYEKLWKLFDNADGTIEGSLAWELFVPTAKHVHAYGERLADHRNQKAKDDGKYDEARHVVYLGAYHVTAAAVRGLLGTTNLPEVTSAEVIHKVEEGEIAHAAVIISVSAAADVEDTKTAIIDRLWNNSTGPLLCRPQGDQLGDRFALPKPPKGEYVDGRSSLFRALCCVRFYVLKLLWPILDPVLRRFYRPAH